MPHSVDKLVFIGFNSRVAALESETGTIVWDWRCPRPASGGYVTLLLLGSQRLVAAVNGYIYCLDPANGELLWSNDTPGFGTGVTSIVSLDLRNPNDPVVAAAQRAAAARASATPTPGGLR